MGYFSNMSLDICIDKIDEFKGLLAEVKMKVSSGIAEDWEQELDLLFLDDYNCLICDEYYAKWYYDQVWLLRIALFAADGEVEFTGEDGERWGYYIENQSVFVMNYQRVKGDKLTVSEQFES